MRWILIALVVTGITSPQEQVTVSGPVEIVREDGLAGCELCEACSDCRATHVVIRTRSSRVEVHLAPAWFLERLEFTPVPGDVAIVTGTRARMPKGSGMAAHEIQVGRNLIKLRDEQGLPLWRRILTDAQSAECARTGR